MFDLCCTVKDAAQKAYEATNDKTQSKNESPKKWTRMDYASFTLKSASTLLRCVCVCLLMYALPELLQNGFMALDIPLAKMDSQGMNSNRYKLLDRRCFIFQHKKADKEDPEQRREKGIVLPDLDHVGDGDGPCDGYFEDEAHFAMFVGDNQGWCEDRSTHPAWGSVQSDWCDSLWPATDEDLTSVEKTRRRQLCDDWLQLGTSTEGACEVTTMLQVFTAFACIAYSICLVAKIIHGLQTWHQNGWADVATHPCTRGACTLSEFWLLSYAPGEVIAPVTAAWNYVEIEVVEVVVNYDLWKLSVVLVLILGTAFVLLTTIGHCCRWCSGNNNDDDNSEARKTCVGIFTNAGWVVTLGFGLAGLVAQIGMAIILLEFPSLNLARIFSFEWDFSLGLAIDFAQLIQFQALSLDIAAVLLEFVEFLMNRRSGPRSS